jgi:tripartite-type tricarboxylate transporter receptor subunit TctC
MLSTLSAKADQPIVDLFGVIGMIGRGLALPPGTPDAYLQALRVAFQKMLNDREYHAEAQRLKLRVVPTPGDELTNAIYNSVNDTDIAVIERARSLTAPK